MAVGKPHDSGNRQPLLGAEDSARERLQSRRRYRGIIAIRAQICRYEGPTENRQKQGKPARALQHRPRRAHSGKREAEQKHAEVQGVVVPVAEQCMCRRKSGRQPQANGAQVRHRPEHHADHQHAENQGNEQARRALIQEMGRA
jgi:hypothetical protein